MNRTAELQRVHAQRRRTVAAIQQAEAWAKAHRVEHPFAFSDFVTMYLDSVKCTTVVQLAELEEQVRTHLRHLQNQHPDPELFN